MSSEIPAVILTLQLGALMTPVSMEQYADGRDGPPREENLEVIAPTWATCRIEGRRFDTSFCLCVVFLPLRGEILRLICHLVAK